MKRWEEASFHNSEDLVWAKEPLPKDPFDGAATDQLPSVTHKPIDSVASGQ